MKLLNIFGINCCKYVLGVKKTNCIKMDILWRDSQQLLIDKIFMQQQWAIVNSIKNNYQLEYGKNRRGHPRMINIDIMTKKTTADSCLGQRGMKKCGQAVWPADSRLKKRILELYLQIHFFIVLEFTKYSWLNNM